MIEARIDISSYKMALARDIIFSDSIVKAIDSRQSGVYKTDDLIYKNIMPFGYIPDVTTIADSYITMFVDMPNINRNNTSFVDIKLTLCIIVHKDRQQVKGITGTRADYIAGELIKLLDGSQKYGYGILELASTREAAFDNVHAYRELIFHTVDMKTSIAKKVGSFK